ncbi:MAG: CRISPR-associated endonuclease Cas2 [Puniceicoccaceae bacterium]|nr:MAG: CRISPR-associated endonuclease Cas2 [Puniceicoccaceae bacterium]
MYILVAYDVATSSPAGARRLRRVAKTCLDYGQRVQNSVFECKLDPALFVEFKSRVLAEIDGSKDSIRIYHLGNNWQQRVEHFGKNTDYNVEGTLLI